MYQQQKQNIMKKLILSALLFPVFLATVAFGQAGTATVEQVVGIPGTQVVVPVNVTGFNNVGAITLYFEYDPAVVTFAGFDNAAVDLNVSGTFYAFDGKWRVGIAWSSNTTANINGKLVDILFTYHGGTSDFVWSQPYCDVRTLPGFVPLVVIYTNGNIGPLEQATVNIVDQLNVVPGPLSVPLEVDFSGVTGGVGSFTFYILYDENILEFQSISDIDPEFAIVDVYALESPPRIVLDYVNPNQSSNLQGTMLKMNFTYTGGNTLLEFDEANCVVANNDVEEISVVYSPGQVTQDPATLLTVSLPNLLADPGTEVSFPLSVTNFANISSFDLRIVFNPGVMSFVGLANYAPPLAAPQFEVFEINGELGISWNGSPVTFNNDILFDIVFNYSTGSSTLVFDLNNCEVADDDLNPQVVVYYNGSISEDIDYIATATIPNVLGTTGQPVDVPVYVTGFTNLGAINFTVAFDPVVMGYVQILNVHPLLSSNGSFTPNNVGGMFYFEWQLNPSLENGPNIPDNDKLFDIRFDFNGGSSALTFVTGECEVSQADDDLTQILVTYYNGSVTGGVVSLEQCTITASPESVELGEPSVITVQLKDQLGNNLPASGGTVVLYTTLGTLTPVVDNYDGTYTATLTSSQSGIAVVTGTINGDTFADDATVKISFLLTLEIAGNGKVKIDGIEYDQPSQLISVTTASVLLEAIPTGIWQIYSWKEGNVVQTPLGAPTYNLTMDSDKTVLATFHLPGDANCDGTVTTQDIIAIANYLKNLNPSPFCFENADVNKSNNITTADITETAIIIKNQ